MAPGVVVERDVAMHARDGTRLLADVHRPDTPGRHPVLLLRTPYGRDAAMAGDVVRERDFFPRHGYVVVVQDCRGRHGSDGDFSPFASPTGTEGTDGYDAVEWAAAQPWSDGSVATVGQSYPAWAQYACAPLTPPHLSAWSPVAGPARWFRTCAYRDGAFELSWMLTYFAYMAENVLTRKDQRGALDAYLRRPGVPLSPLKPECFGHRPVADWGDRLAAGVPYFADLIAHDADGPFWDGLDAVRLAHQVTAPGLHVGSWYDAFQDDTLSFFTAIRGGGVSSEAGRSQKLVMGPWAHQVSFARPTTAGTGDADFGSEAAIELHELQLRFFDEHLRGRPPSSESAPVRIFVMGDNRWRDEDEWPLRRAVDVSLHLRSGGRANTSTGDGRLTAEPPSGDEPWDSFDYDPADPVPTRGGAVLGLAAGVFDQAPVEVRRDVLVYTSAPLAADVEVTGKVRLVLHVASSAPETDFTAKVSDVRADGYSGNVVEGILRARPSAWPAEITVDLWSTSYVFRRGHRIRLDITSSCAPRWAPNPNTGEPTATATTTVVAHQSVFHDGFRRSRLLLPVVAGRGQLDRALSGQQPT